MTGPLSPARQAFVSVFVARVSATSGMPYVVEETNKDGYGGISFVIEMCFAAMVIGLKALVRKLTP